MRWMDGPERFARVVKLLARLERLVRALTRDELLTEADRESIDRYYERLALDIIQAVEHEQQRILDEATGPLASPAPVIPLDEPAV